MNINVLILTKFKCLFNKNYQKRDSESELREKYQKGNKKIKVKIYVMSQ